MKRVRLYLRIIVLTIVALLVLLPTAVYIVLSTSWFTDKLKDIGEKELTELLGTEVKVGKMRIEPFTKVALNDVVVKDDFGKDALVVDRLETGFEFWDFISTGRPKFDYVLLDGADISLYRKSKDSPLNIEGIIERLKSDDTDKPKPKFDVAVYTVKVQDATFRYNVLDAPVLESKFDGNHIELSDIALSLTAPKISDKEISGKIRRLAFTDRSGLKVTDLQADVLYTPENVKVSGLKVELPSSRFLLGELATTYNDPSDLNKLFNEEPIEVTLEKGSYFTLSDFAPFVPLLNNVDRRFNIDFIVGLSKRLLDIEKFNLGEVTDGGFLTTVKGQLCHPFDNSLTFNNVSFEAKLFPASLTDLLKKIGRPMQTKEASVLNRLGMVSVSGKIDGGLNDLSAESVVKSRVGEIDLNAQLKNEGKTELRLASGRINAVNLDLGQLLETSSVGIINADIDAEAALLGKELRYMTVDIVNGSAEIKGQAIDEISARLSLSENKDFEGKVDASSDKSELLLSFNGNYDKTRPFLAAKTSVARLRPSDFGLFEKYRDYEFDVDIDMNLTGEKGRWIDGYIDISNLLFRKPDTDAPALYVEHFNIVANNTVRPNIVEVTSDFLNGTVEGDLSLLNLFQQGRNIVASAIPALTGPVSLKPVMEGLRDNNFHFNFELNNTENIVNFFNLPITVIYPVAITGNLDSNTGFMTMGVDAPYLMKGDMIIENTSVDAQFFSETEEGRIYLTTQFPTKKGDMIVSGGIDIVRDCLSSEIDWKIDRLKPINGTLDFDTKLSRHPDNGKLCAEVNFKPSEITFGQDIWHFKPSVVAYKPGKIEIDNFGLNTQTQSIEIDGICMEEDPESEIKINLDSVVLNTIFETLDIDKALIGGVATGTLHAGGIFGQHPFVTCDDLHVDNIGYNNCVLGDGDIKTHWNNEKKSFYLDAVVSQAGGKKSFIKGDIFPASESLDISFDADSVNVGFMKPFMDAFAEDITGNASGKVRLFGTFKYIDMEGDVYAHNLGLKVGFTNTWYFASDSIHITPGLIDVSDITVRDIEGHTALLNGVVKHNFFKDPVFDFKVTDARNFLSYDVTPAISPDWYGRIYGNGSAFINGSPGIVNIDVSMTTAENSTFTFVLSDTEEAEQYNFITFRDKNRHVVTDSIIQKEILPQAVIEYRDRLRRKALEQNPPSAYNMNIQVDITPAAKIILVMDPVGGDEIKSWGNGNLRMTYASKGNDLRMYGSYIIDRGSYNFTLQDIIVKDFTIKEGSSITFTGDPYNAALDITASYAVNANLSDLDESFINDPELNRTNVPVRALLLVRGDMRQPDIDFDLEFPTLTSDVYRKVRSIVSTDEMMNRQIIYLLALNRFYTPEYMSATKGNELFSVASSTISSRLSSMLGKLSENWTISPNLRSDKGDFTDVQFDVALSSNLLNNRLRMNGNFGYRDKSLNTTQFIGDFDLEYLLNRTGTWRLKAYNRFNDQTYFLRTAKTTQGVGLMFQREFDSFFNFLWNKKKPVETPAENKDRLENKNDSTSQSNLAKTGEFD